MILIFWLIPKTQFIKNANLSRRQIRLLLAFKITTGIVCAFYFGRMPLIGDYINYNIEGKIQYQLLLSNPVLFFTDFKQDVQTYGLGGLFESSNSFWAYLRFNLLFKFIAIINLVSHGNFYINSAIFSSIVFFGHIAFYRIYTDIYQGNKVKVLFACFLLPSLLLYTSCVHKDGMVFLATGIVSFVFYKHLTYPKSFTIKYSLLFIFAVTTIFLFRNYVLVALLPAMLTALLSKLLPYKNRVGFIISYTFFLLLFFLSSLCNNLFNLPAAVVKRKADFALLGEANTNIHMNDLQPTLTSFLSNLPQAIEHFLFRPYLWEFSTPGVILTALELIFYEAIVVTFIFFRKKQVGTVHSFNVFGCAFFINMMLIIGYTIPNIGAIVRYRSIFWIFLICPLLCNINWKRIFSGSKNS